MKIKVICLNCKKGIYKYPSHVRDNNFCCRKCVVDYANNIHNNRYNRLVVISGPHKKNKYSYFECMCDCGKTVLVQGCQLKSGHTKSCGCFLSDKCTITFRKSPGQAGLRVLYRSYRDGAKKRNLEFVLLEEEFKNITSDNCFYCGIKPNQIRKPNGKSYTNDGILHAQYIYNDIDRIDNNKGYMKDNCIACCKDCNLSKRTRSKDEFLDWINRVYQYTNKLKINIPERVTHEIN